MSASRPLAVDPEVDAVLARLRQAADTTAGSWPDLEWRREEGPGPDRVSYTRSAFRGLVLEPGEDLVLATDLVLPESIAGVAVGADPVEVTLNTLYPAQMEWAGECLFDDIDGARPGESQDVMAAPSPVLVSALPASGSTEVRLRLRAPDNQLMPWWVHLGFTTPGLRRRWEMLDVAWARLALAQALAVSDEDATAVAKAASLVPDHLVTDDEAVLASALDAMAGALDRFEERAAAIKVHVVSHCHIDLSWLWTWPDTEATVLRDVRSVVAMMDDYPELTFTHSQPETYEVVRRRAPDLFERVQALVAAGRWEPATMTWVEGDTNMASGEALARQLLEGVGWTREHLGVAPRVYLAPDNFGHPGNLPQLARSAGAEVYYHSRANPGGAAPWPAYWWEGDDGTRILAVSTVKYNGDISAGDLARAAITAHRHGLGVGLHFHGMGDHGGGPSRRHLDTLRRLEGATGLPTAGCSTLSGFASALLSGGAELPVHQGESRTIFEGCYSTHGDSKGWNRDDEQALVTAGALAAMAGDGTAGAALVDPWRTTLFNQFHDILAGSSIAEVYDQHRNDHVRVAEATAQVRSSALGALAARAGADAAGTVCVTNPSGWERLDVVEIGADEGLAVDSPVWLEGSHGHSTAAQPTATGGLCFVARVPAWSTVSYRVGPDTGHLPAPMRAEPCFAPVGGRQTAVLDIDDVVEEPFLRVATPLLTAHVRRDSGIVVSLVDHRVGDRELVGFGLRRPSDYQDAARTDLALNVWQVVEEKTHGMSAWQLAEVWRETTLLGTATTEVVEEGPVRVVLEVRHRFGEGPSQIVERLAFYRDLARVDAVADVDWNEPGGPTTGIPSLKVGVAARLEESEAWFETPFDVVRRPADGQESPALRWAWVGGGEYGVALLNDSRYAYDALGTRLRLTVARSAYSPDPAAGPGRSTIRFSIVPGPGGWTDAGVARTAAGFNEPLIGHRVAAGGSVPAAAPALDPAGIRLDGAALPTALRAAADGEGLVMRLWQCRPDRSSTTIAGLPAGATVERCSLVETDCRPLPVEADGSCLVELGPFEVATLRIR